LNEQFKLPPLNLQQMGMPLARNGQSEILETIPVTQAMQAIPVVLTEDLSAVAGLATLTGQSTHSGLVVNANGELVGIVTLSDLNRAIAQKQTQIQQSQSPTPTTLTVGKICSQPLVCIYSHESLATALSQMIGRGLHQLPVVTETPPHTLLGLLTLPDISLAYNLALSQQTLAQVIPIADSPAVLLAAE
jgi:CBS domain-containing protein